MNRLRSFPSIIWLAALLWMLAQLPANAQQTADTLPSLAIIQARLNKLTSDSIKLDQYSDMTGKLMDVSRDKDATVLSEEALSLAQRLGKKRTIAFFLNRLGDINMYASRYPEAIHLFQQSLDAATSVSDTNRMIMSLLRLGQSYANTSELNLAGKYLAQALQLALRSQSKKLAYCYNELAVLEGKRKNPRKAIEYGNQSMAIDKKNNAMADYYATLLNNAICYKNLNQYTQAVAAYQDVLAYSIREKQVYHKISAYVNLPWALLPLNRLDEAEKYARLAIQLVNEENLSNKKEYLEEAYNALTKISQQKGDYRSALDYREKAIAYHDSIFNATKSQQLLELTTRYETVKKEGQIKELNAQNDRKQLQLLYLGGGALLLLVALGLVLGLYRRLGRVNQQLATNNQQLNHTLEALKTTQTQLVQKEKMASLGELTAGIAHEIQNPLNFVNNFSAISTELLEEIKEERQKQERDEELETEILGDLSGNLAKINHHGGRAASIVKSMLEHSRTSTGEKRLTDLNVLTDEYMRLSYHGLRAKDKEFNCTLDTQFDPSVDKLEVIPQDLGRVLLNLFNNAFYAVAERQKHGEPGYQPGVSVQTSQQDGQVQIRVRDNGMGIPESVVAKIFQPFFTTKPAGEGTGLGLSLSYDIVTKGHGGSLLVESQPGKGTEFVIQLPIVKATVRS